LALLPTIASSCILAASALAQSFTLDWFTVASGGGTSTRGAFALSGTIGQPQASPQPWTGGDFSLTDGFWALVAVYTPGAPRLAITRNSQLSTVTVSWPSPSTGFVLEQTADLNTSNWISSPQLVYDNGTNKFIIVAPPTGNRFYRLFKP